MFWIIRSLSTVDLPLKHAHQDVSVARLTLRGCFERSRRPRTTSHGCVQLDRRTRVQHHIVSVALATLITLNLSTELGVESC